MEKTKGFTFRVRGAIRRLHHFLTREIWSIRLEDYPSKLKYLIKYIRVVLLALRGFNENKVTVRASALTYYTLMSIVPVFAMAFGIAKGFGFEKYLEEQIINTFKGQEEVMNQVINFSNSLLERTGGGVLAGIGVVVLFFSVIKVLSTIENFFNDIWQIDRARTFSRKFSDYLSMILLAPLLLISSGSIHLYLATQLDTIADQVQLIDYISPVLIPFLNFLPYLITWVLFSLVYIVMPNTKVSAKSGILAGVIAGTAFAVTQWLYIDFQVGVSRYNAIYGSFAALPLFLIWMQVSWLIVLFGAEISFANQNVEMYEYEAETDLISSRSRKNLSLLLVSHIVKQFIKGETPLTALELSRELHIPVRLMRSLLHNLKKCKIIAEVCTNDPKTPAFQPAQHIDKFTVSYVINELDTLGHAFEPESAEMKRILSIHQNFCGKIENLPENIQVKDI